MVKELGFVTNIIEEVQLRLVLDSFLFYYDKQYRYNVYVSFPLIF